MLGWRDVDLLHRENERRREVPVSVDLVLLAHDQHGELRRLPDFRIELPLHRLRVREQRRLARELTRRAHEEIAFPVDRAEPPVLHFEQRVRNPRHLRPVAEVGGEYVQLLAPGELRIAPEEALDAAPGEEVRMHDLVGITAEHELIRLLQGLQHQSELGRREILHFVDDREGVAGTCERSPLVSEQARIEELGFHKPGAVLLEEVIQAIPLILRKDRLTQAQATVGLTGEDSAGLRRQHAANLLEGLVGIHSLVSLPHTREPPGELPPRDLAAGWHPDRLHLEILVKNVDVLPAEFESNDFNREVVIPGGTELPVYVGPLKPGTYAFFNDFHQASTGKLIVRPARS